ncbi:uncharacterized protein LOC135155737 [Lytechinus pictus]|uniref:uncharacterized protein LOC135155737 n=1 Tax=Lytechinus pictus TaxID=7653 RepID=UPI0030BA1EDD
MERLCIPLAIILLSLIGALAQPQPPYTAADIEDLGEDVADDLIEHYYTNGYTALEVIAFLIARHGIIRSLRQVRRIIQRRHIRRRDVRSAAADVVNAIRVELRGSGQNLGYRSMWRRLRTRHNIYATQDDVRELLTLLDVEGVQRRSTRRLRRRQYVSVGPNHVIHVDGYDKLKPYGFAVHGAIDGFSRKVLWLRVGYSNNDPRFVARFYLNFVRNINGVPRIVRCDRGTENCLIRDIQIALRWDHNDCFDRHRSFRYGRSTSNQRIESWWGHLGRLSSRYWIELFKHLRDVGEFDNSNPVHIEAIRLCFQRLIQRDFDRTVQEWNQHCIRSQNNEELPYGVPDLMYHVPEMFGTEDQKMPLMYSAQELEDTSRAVSLDYPVYGCSQEFVDAVNAHVGNLDNFELPDSVEDALDLYEHLVNLFL